MKRGRVIKSTGSWYIVEDQNGEHIEARVRGRFRQDQIRSTNPIAVGDWVKYSGEEGEKLIHEVERRKNYIIRRSVNLSRQSHIIASNLDQAIMVATLKNPQTHPIFIDRFCVAAEAFHIPVGVVFNKIDLLDDEEREMLESFRSVYIDLGYTTVVCSAETGEGLNELKMMLENKVSLFSGHSGVGKSTLINELDPSMNIKTGEISEIHLTGQHTTTFAEMHKLNFGGYIVDTPGIRGFGLIDFEKEELAGYFPEMRKLLPDCRFYNCIHINEPGCAVKEGIQTGEVAETRYNSYLNMYYEKEDEHYR